MRGLVTIEGIVQVRESHLVSILHHEDELWPDVFPPKVCLGHEDIGTDAMLRHNFVIYLYHLEPLQLIKGKFNGSGLPRIHISYKIA